MQITVNLDTLDLSTVIGEKRVYDHDCDEPHGEPMTLGDAVVRELAKRLWASVGSDALSEVRQRAAQIRNEEIRARVAPIVQAAVDEPIQQTNSFGEPNGKPTTLRELIAAEARAQLGTRSDYGRGPRVVDKLVADAVSAEIKKELAEAIKEEKAKVVAAVRAKAADLIAQAVREGVGR